MKCWEYRVVKRPGQLEFPSFKLDKPGIVAKAVNSLTEWSRKQVHHWVIWEATEGDVAGIFLVAIGPEFIRIRDAVKAPLCDGATRMIYAKSITNGDPRPNEKDRLFTSNLETVAGAMGISLVESIIFCENRNWWGARADAGRISNLQEVFPGFAR